MNFTPPLQPATLIERYKRFLADVTLADGNTITVHVSNTGAMTGCGSPGDTVWLSHSDNPKRKHAYSWELTQTSTQHFICVNTIRANQLVEQALLADELAPLTGYRHLKREAKYGEEKSRIDFLLTDPERADCYVEVKSVTLLADNQGQGLFPDAVTVRGQKHLRELIKVKQSGKRAVLLFAVLHTGIDRVSPAKLVDSVYTDLINQALMAGVEIFAYKAQLTETNWHLSQPIPFIPSK
ncbi:DNA/RNA nuclease SfsA [Motilimonas pumila]|uniref:Sugar fermentation stimulation protein homolog n=1 Tax=Motilimonas pumila TaxID=2303987 RepID=A0A418YC24_9GAMM|nr:DNA/RNA nuclease SfsA [Motilimonas pumila]RJG42077.1 DNA/RNA nuclease SfsA [Motilimonas pumila]